MLSKFSSNAQQFKVELGRVLTGKDPYFISRIGGSDTDAVVDYLRVKNLEGDELSVHLARHLPIVERFNGFYDTSSKVDDKIATYLKYIEALESYYRQTKMMTCCHPHTLSLFFQDVLAERFVKDDFPNREMMFQFLTEIATAERFARAYPYNMIECIVQNPFTLFWVLADVLPGKKVLAITPFSQSIMQNFHNRHNFFKNSYTYPDFEIETVNVPITYSGIGKSLYPDSNWFETVSRLKGEISSKKFDIALLSCGSYALPLGFHIEQELARHAVYVGGVLQLFFGIIGRRYRNIFFEDQMNLRNFIEPVEKKLYAPHIPSDDSAVREAFGAYF